MMPYTVRERVKTFTSDGAMTLDGGGARVEAIPLEHGQTPHLAYRIRCGGRVLVHFGDATPSEGNFTRVAAAGPSDIAMVPYWWLTNAGALSFLKDTWKPKQVVAFHIGASDEGAVPTVRQNAPAAWICTRQGESREY